MATAAKSRLSAQRTNDVMGCHLSAIMVELKAALIKQNETAPHAQSGHPDSTG
jgi:hypothetical protein